MSFEKYFYFKGFVREKGKIFHLHHLFFVYKKALIIIIWRDDFNAGQEAKKEPSSKRTMTYVRVWLFF